MRLDASRVAVAGVSSGAYMATQVHVALNSRIHGAALFAGGPYGCAQGALETALGPCMSAQPAAPDAAALAAAARARAEAGRIDPVAAFAGDRVLVFHGATDATVSPSLAPVTAAFYTALGGEGLALTLDDQRPLGHTFPTLEVGTPCDAPGSPWLSSCGIDGAGEAMQALFGAPDVAPEPATGLLQAFDQTGLFPEGGVSGLADRGYVYTPKACTDAACGALLVFHGCQQKRRGHR